MRLIRVLIMVWVLSGLMAMGIAVAADEAKPAKAKVEVVFCLDTTSSMGGLIAGAQQKIWSIVNGIVSGKPVPDVKVGLVSFRDRGDDYVSQVVDLTGDLDSIHEKLFALKAEGGGDGPESVNQALAESVNKISWTAKGERVYRVIFLVGDAPPHMDYQNDVKYADSCQSAVKKDIVINTVRCGNDTETGTVWQDIANRAEGKFTTIAQTGGVAVVSTPHDARLAELSGKLTSSGVFYGSDDARESAKKAVSRSKSMSDRDMNDSAGIAMEADKAEFRAKMSVAAAAAPSASSEEMSGMGMGAEVGRADLLGLFLRDGEEGLKKIKDNEWPEEMQKMSETERVNHLKRLVAERKTIEEQIAEASKKRSEFIKEEQKKSGSGDSGFDGVVLEMLKEQGAKKGIEYK